MSNKEKVLILIAVLVAAAAFWYWYANRDRLPFPSSQSSVSNVVPVAPSLGEKIYEQNQNPLGDKVPTLNPVTNPIQGAYKNPFE